MYQLPVSRFLHRASLQRGLVLRQSKRIRGNHVSSFAANPPQRSLIYPLFWAAGGGIAVYTAVLLGQPSNITKKDGDNQKITTKYADQDTMLLVCVLFKIAW